MGFFFFFSPTSLVLQKDKVLHQATLVIPESVLKGDSIHGLSGIKVAVN